MSESPAVGLALADQPVSIRAEVSLADGDTCKFTVSRSLHPGGPFFLANREQAASSPLAERLFALGGVSNVLIAGNVMTLSKAPGTEWIKLKTAVGAAIRTQLLSGVPAMLEAPGAIGAGTGSPVRSDA